MSCGISNQFGGLYDPHDRHQNVHKTWDLEKPKFREQISRKIQNILDNAEESFEPAETRGGYGTGIDGIRQDIANFQQQSLKFEGPHFTKQLRILRETCLKIQGSLDKIENNGQEDVRTVRKDLMAQTEEIWKSVFNKVHPNACKDCEVKFV